MVPQPNSPPSTHVIDEAVSFGEDDRMVRAATTVSSLEARHDNGIINKTQSMATPPATGSLGTSSASGLGCHVTIGDTPVQTRSERVFTMPHDSPLPRVNTLGSDEGSLQHNELMDLVTKLSDKVTALETDLKETKKVYGAVYTKLIKKDISTAGVEVSTASTEVKTAGDFGDDIAAETLVYIRRSAAKAKDKGKGIIEESESAMTKTKTKRQQEQERIGLETTMRLQEEFDEEKRQRIARRMLEEERESLSIEERSRLLAEFIDKRKKLQAAKRAEEIRNKPPTRAERRKYMTTFLKNQSNWKAIQFTGYLFEEIKQIFNAVYKEVHSFMPMGIEEESERTKRPGQSLQQESLRRQKTGEASGSAEGQKDKEAGELSQEELQQMVIIVPEEGMNIEALQTKYLIIDWEIYTEVSKNLVQERFNSTEPTEDKERELWVELKRLFKPDADDELWKS
ncbi:hypothetical protein Tco_0888800 [Tanacetum coccineum]